MAERRKKTGRTFGETDYRNGAAERLENARTLLDREQFAGGIYMAGRAVEGMLRAVIWKTDPEIQQGRKSLETGHDLRELLALVRDLGLLTAGGDESFKDRVSRIARLWFNNMRFAPNKFVEKRWRELGEVHKDKTFKQAAEAYHDDCAQVLKRCERLWQL